MLKYACNCYHALKVAFANEIGAACKAFDIDSHAVMKIFAEDRRLNISSAYLTPGFAFGGSCLPKDLRAMLYAAQQADLELPVLRSTLLSNQHVIARAADVLLTRDVRRVALLGLSFKTGTDDLRESPLVTLAEQLLGKGIALSIYDPYVSTAYVTGANRAFIEAHIPHIWALFAPELEAAIAGADAVVVGNPHPDFRRVKELMAPHQLLLDLVRISPTVTSDGQTYEGIAW
jgi:GDP-mannose 6-dehydrogenase